MPKGIGGPNLDWRASRIAAPSPAVRPLSPPGETTAKALRRRLSLEPETIPEPPIPHRQKSIVPLLGRLGLLTVFAGTVAYAITFYSIPETRLETANSEYGI